MLTWKQLRVTTSTMQWQAGAPHDCGSPAEYIQEDRQ